MIVVFGSLNMDLVLRVPALPAPGQTVLTPSHTRACGGKGANQAVAAARAGASVRMVGCVGRDESGDILLEALAADGIDAQAVRGSTRPTGLAVVVVDAAGENQIVVASGANLEARADQVPDDWLGPATTIVLQHEVPAGESRALGRRARRSGARVVLNAAPAGPVDPDTFDILIVNDGEARAAARAAGIAARAATSAARAMAKRWDRIVIVTLGSHGAAAFTPERAFSVAALAIEPVDTTGAGDAFVGAFAATLDRGETLEHALGTGAVAGALACLTLGAQPSLPRADAIADRLGELAPVRARVLER